MSAVIRQHNSSKKTENENFAGGKSCNCRIKDNCPLHGKCQVESVVYKATVTTTNDEKDYIGLTAQTFKQRYYSHQHSMRDNKYRNSTSLSQHVWVLKDQGIDFSIQWSIQRKATEYQNTTKRCNLCLAEKVEIISADKVRSLNKKTELTDIEMQARAQVLFVKLSATSALVQSSCTLSMLVLTFSVSA